MSDLIKHAIIKDGVVVNVIEYEQTIQGTPPGFDDGVIAIPAENVNPGWHYADGKFTDPSPPETIFVEPPKSLTEQILSDPVELAKLKTALGL
jgi:hypothetical protein